jgi:5,10-methylenetetrahydromethanopterin reductase
LVSWLYTCVDEDEKQALQLVRKGVAVAIWGSRPILEEIGFDLPKEYLDFMDSQKYTLSEEVITEAMKLIPDEVVEHFSIAGPPEKCAQKIARILDLGIKHVAIWPFPPKITDVETVLKPFAEKVIPRVKALMGA